MVQWLCNMLVRCACAMLRDGTLHCVALSVQVALRGAEWGRNGDADREPGKQRGIEVGSIGVPDPYAQCQG